MGVWVPPAMSRNDPPRRREFLKKTAATAGVIGSTGLAAASHDDTEVTISSQNGTGSYEIYVNEEDYNAHGENLESADGIDVSGGLTKFTGTISSTSDEDTYYYNGEIVRIELWGSIVADIYNPNVNVSGTVTVSGDDGTEYSMCVKNYFYPNSSDTRDLESCDTFHDNDQCVSGCIDGAGDEDYYDAYGTMLFFSNLNSGKATLDYTQN